MDLTEFNEIRSYNDEELPQIFEELIADPAFQKVVAGVIPNVPFELLAQKMRACKTKREFQEAFCYGILWKIAQEHTDSLTLDHSRILRIPYSCCGVLAAAITYDKFACNQYLKAFGVRIAESLLLRQGQSVSDEDVIEKIGLPCFIKPSLGGSSFGVTKVKTKEQIQPAIVKAFGEAEEVIVEAFMEGTELTCGCYKTKEKSVVFPPTEVVTHNEFFDYDAKYNGQVDEITPARISPELTGRVQKLTSAIYDILGCSGIIRVDYIVTAGEKLNLLEVNTTPGMTATSFIPQQVRAAGLDIKDVMTDIIENKF